MPLEEYVPTISDTFLKPDEVAKKLRISRSQVYTLVSEGKLPALKIDGAYRFPASFLQLWMTENMTTRRGGKK